MNKNDFKLKQTKILQLKTKLNVYIITLYLKYMKVDDLCLNKSMICLNFFRFTSSVPTLLSGFVKHR